MLNRRPILSKKNFLDLKKKETTLLTIVCLVRRVLRIFGSWINDPYFFLFFFVEYEYRKEDRLITFKKIYGNFPEIIAIIELIERFMFGSGRDRRSFEMNGKTIYFH